MPKSHANFGNYEHLCKTCKDSCLEQTKVDTLLIIINKNNTNMKKLIVLMALISLPMFASAQTTEKQYYLYNIVTFSGSLKNEGFKVDLDDGKTIEKLKDSNGNKMKFNTPAAALMYLYSLGWELYVNGATSEGAMAAGYGASETTSYWIMRKPCTKEEFDKAVEEGIRK